jgi:hypothetical protein
VTTFAIWNVSADAAIVGIAAAAAALIAAVTAQTRLRAQLAHDTILREREATREALDDVVKEINAAAMALNVSAGAMLEYSRTRLATIKTGHDHGIVKAEQEAMTAMGKLRAVRLPVMVAAFRLHLRFPDSDPIIGAFADWRASIDQLVDDYEGVLDADDFTLPARLEASDKTRSTLGEQLNRFLSTARRWGSNAPA